jgi:DNA (cytosine-5)-methyltransferase 1
MGMGGGYVPMVIDGIAIRTNNEKGYDIAQDGDTINLEQPNSKTRRGRVGKQIAQTLNTSTQQAVVIKDEVNVVGNYMKSGYDASRIINPDGIAPAVKENHGTVTAVAVSKPELEKAGEQKIIPCEIRTDGIVTYKDKVMGCPRTVNQGGDKYIISYAADKETGKPMESYSYRIRKLTPRECFRLMGFKDIDFTKAKYKFDKESDSIWEIMGKDILESDKVKQIEEMGIKVSERTSNSQCYKQAGNSIVVDVLEAIFRNMNIKGVKRWND